MERSDSTVPVINYPSSPEPSDEIDPYETAERVYRELTEDSINSVMEEHDETVVGSPPLVRSVSSPDRILGNHNFSGHFDHHDEGSIPPPPPPPPRANSPETPPSSHPATPIGIPSSEMGAPSPERIYEDMIGDLDIMIEIARSMHEVARHTKSLLHTAYDRVDLADPRVQNLGMAGVLKDLRQESAHSVVDGQRSQLRYEKVLSDVRRLRRCLRNLGFWRVAGVGPASTSPHQLPSTSSSHQPDTSWGLPHYSYFSNDF